MKLFVTGGTGFVGSHFLKAAIAAGHEVVALRRPGSKTRIPLERDPIWLETGMDAVPAGAMKGADVVVHLAAHSANVPYDSYEACHHWNVTIPLRLMEQADAEGVRNWVVAGSCFEYGKSGERYEFIPVTAPLEPVGSYPTSKASASIAMSGFARDRKFSLSIHRIFQVYGEGELESRFWPSLKKAALSGADFAMTEGKQIRDFVPVEYVAEKLLAACVQEPVYGIPLIKNLGTGCPKSLGEFAGELWKQFNATGSLRLGAVATRPNEIMRFVPEV